MATNLAQDGSAICAELNPGNVNNKRFPPLSVIWRWLRELTLSQDGTLKRRSKPGRRIPCDFSRVRGLTFSPDSQPFERYPTRK
jgi:hypothetical protein